MLRPVEIHPTVQAIFDTHAAPSHCSTQEVHDMAAPLLKIGTRMQRQLAEYREKVIEAELTPHGHDIQGSLEMMHQTFRALESASAAFVQAGRDMANAMRQLDRYLGEAKEGIARQVASEAADAERKAAASTT